MIHDARARAATASTSAGRAVALALWLTVTLRLALEVVGVTALRLDPRPLQRDIAAWTDLELRDPGILAQLVVPWQRWDALWYQRIAEHGYAAGDASVVFFPLYPLLSRAVTFAVGNTTLAQLVVSTAAFAVAATFLYRLVALRERRRVAALSVVLLASFPTGFYLFAPYTESLFLACAVVSFWGMATGSRAMAGLAAALAATTRTVGVLLVVALLVRALEPGLRPRERVGWLIAAGAPAAGFAAAILAPMLLSGERTTAFTLQGQWGARTTLPWEALGSSLEHVVARGDPIEALNLLSVLGFAALAIVVARRRPPAETAYVVASVLVLASRELANLSPLLSASRLVLVIFPCFIAGAVLLERRPRLAAAIVVVAASLQVLLFAHFARWGFVA